VKALNGRTAIFKWLFIVCVVFAWLSGTVCDGCRSSPYSFIVLSG